MQSPRRNCCEDKRRTWIKLIRLMSSWVSPLHLISRINFKRMEFSKKPLRNTRTLSRARRILKRLSYESTWVTFTSLKRNTVLQLKCTEWFMIGYLQLPRKWGSRSWKTSAMPLSKKANSRYYYSQHKIIEYYCIFSIFCLIWHFICFLRCVCEFIGSHQHIWDNHERKSWFLNRVQFTIVLVRSRR